MPELWDIYDKNRNKTGRVIEREKYEFKQGEYFIVVAALIINSKKEILITKRAATKKAEPLKWELTGGGLQSGETSLDGVLREIKEEIGLDFKPTEAIYLTEIRKDSVPADFKDIWLFKKDVKIEDITFSDKEVIDVKWVKIDEFLKMKENNEVISTIDFGIKEYKLALKKANFGNETY